MKDWHGFPNRGRGKSVLYVQRSGRDIRAPEVQNMVTRTELGEQIRKAFVQNEGLVSVDYDLLERKYFQDGSNLSGLTGSDYTLLSVDELANYNPCADTTAFDKAYHDRRYLQQLSEFWNSSEFLQSLNACNKDSRAEILADFGIIVGEN